MYLAISIIIMALVTYLLRVIPLACFKKKIENKYVKSFLYYVPYAVLSCMTFPAIFYSTNNTYTAIIGTSVALGASFFKLKLIYVVIITVCIVFGFSFIFY
ncbi:MAG: AzlD domain-containing protein [Acholeplasmatales bacterium]|nr:AzlD domain-containing protein [Acholeplasmatales bacterium]